MIFLYTINNPDVLLLSRPHHSGFLMKQLSPPSIQARPSGASVWTTPAHSHHPPVPLSKFARNPSGLRWDEQIMLATPRGERSPELWVTTVIWKTQRRRVVTARWASEMHVSRCCQVLIAGLACKELKMQSEKERVSFSGPVDKVPDKITHLLSKKKH